MKKRDPLIRFYLDNRRYWPGLIVLFVMAMMAGVFKSLSSVYWGRAVDAGVAGLLSEMITTSAIAAGIILLDSLRQALYYKLIGHTTEGMFLDFRLRAYEALGTADMATLERETRSGDMAMRVNSDMDSLSDFIAASIPNILRLAFQALFAILSCFLISWKLSAAYYVILPVSLWVIQKVSGAIRRRSKAALDYTGQAASLASEMVGGILTIKAFRGEKEMDRRFHGFMQKSFEQTMKNERTNMIMTGVKFFTTIFQLMVLFVFGAFLVQSGSLSVGNLIAFVGLTAYVTELFGSIDYYIRNIRQGQALCQRIYEVFDIAREQSGKETSPREAGRYLAGEALDFSYEEKAVFQKLFFSIEKGQTVAIVGSSGCGKSTLLKLIAHFYLPTAGHLELFGVPAEQWNVTALRRRLALVSQDAYLFDGTIFENVAYGRPGASREDVIRVLNEVGLWGFVESLPEGLDYRVGEQGNRLSGGQRQRVCIARAMLKNAELILLDEATSALDTQSEREVQGALNHLLKNRSALVVAHRMSTVKDVDYVYYLKDGGIAEQGSPQALLQQKGAFYTACKQQGVV